MGEAGEGEGEKEVMVLDLPGGCYDHPVVILFFKEEQVACVFIVSFDSLLQNTIQPINLPMFIGIIPILHINAEMRITPTEL